MRNIDKIKSLEKELGRYRKAVETRDKLICRMRDELERDQSGIRELQAATDALLTAVALEYGTQVMDEESGESLGWRLYVSLFDVGTMRDAYDVHARRDEERNAYVVGVVKKEDSMC